MPHRATRFLDLDSMRLLIQSIGVEAALRGLVEVLRADFARWPEFEKSARTANHSQVGVIELMPISDDRWFCFKFVTGHPRNIEKGLLTVMAFGALAEMDSGWPLLISEMTILTALRTAATSVLAAQLLARADSRSMAMIGCGAQSEFQILGFHHLLGIRQFRLYDVDGEAMERVARNLGSNRGLNLVSCGSTEEAVRGTDIVTTCTADKRLATVLTNEMVEPGMHLNAVGGDCPGKTELAPEILTRGRVFVEYAPQTRIEGEIQQADPEFPVTELWEVLNRVKKGRESAEEVTVFDSVGFALEDFSSLRFTYEEALRHGVGTDLSLVPVMPDVKDLFGLVRQATSAVELR